MKNESTLREKLKVTRLVIGLLAIFVSYVCLALLPLSTLFGLSFASGAAMTVGGTGHSGVSIFLLPLLVGSVAWLVAVLFGPGLIIRLLCIPSSVGYIATVLFLRKFA